MTRSPPPYLALGPAHADDEDAATVRHELRLRLESLRAAHGVLAPRLDAVRSERLARGAKADPVLDQARRSLFGAYRELSKALAGEISDTDSGLVARIIEADTEAAAVDAERETRQELIRSAAASTGVAARRFSSVSQRRWRFEKSCRSDKRTTRRSQRSFGTTSPKPSDWTRFESSESLRVSAATPCCSWSTSPAASELVVDRRRRVGRSPRVELAGTPQALLHGLHDVRDQLRFGRRAGIADNSHETLPIRPGAGTSANRTPASPRDSTGLQAGFTILGVAKGRRLKLLGNTRSLLLTGLADVRSAVQDESRRPGDRLGLALMVASAACFALMAAIVKKMLPHTPMQSVVLSRGILMTATFVTLARRQGVPILGNNPPMLLLRGLLGYGALSCYFWSVQHLPLGDAVLLQYSHPVFVAAIAPFFLREAIGRWHWPLVLAALCGVALIVGPAGHLRGPAMIGLLGSMLSGLAYMAVRKLSKTEHILTILVWFPLATIPLALVATLHEGAAAIPKSIHEIAGHLLVYASALLGQASLTEGLARAGAARATAVTMTGPVFGLLFGWLLFGTPPSAASMAGTIVVIGAVVLLARRPRSSSPATT